MFCQLGLGGGAVTAVGALVRFFSGMLPGVDFEVTQNICLVWANITLVDFLRRCWKTLSQIFTISTQLDRMDNSRASGQILMY